MSNRRKFSKEELDIILTYDRETGLFFWKEGYSARVAAGSRADKPQKFGYRYINIWRVNYMAHLIAWVMHYGCWPSKTIDHRDRVRSNNWITNLREATRAEQQANLIRKVRGKSGFRGVYWDGRNGGLPTSRNWVARIQVGSSHTILGYFSTPEAASEAFETAARKQWPDFYAGSPALSPTRSTL